jgi:hypothetical protein
MRSVSIVFRRTLRSWLWAVAAAAVALAACGLQAEEPKPSAENHLPLPTLDPQLRDRLTAYLKAHPMTPEEYVIFKFRDHDVICLGENHRFKHNPELISRLIPLLHKNGIFTLGTEFARREDQPLIDKLLEGAEYDEALARDIMFRSAVDWGYQEYVDIYRAAWEVNHRLPPGVRKFRILGVEGSPDWSLIEKPEDRKNPEIMSKVSPPDHEKYYAQVILDNVVAKGEKALVYSGSAHAATEYQEPILDGKSHRFIKFKDDRMGNYLFRAIGKKAITIYLHYPWFSSSGYNGPLVYAADGVIDALIQSLPPDLRRVGFDTQGTPFGELTGKTAFYSQGYDHFTLATFCDGYIIEKPLSEYVGVTVIPNFINETNLERALQGIPSRLRHWDVEAFNRVIAEDLAKARHPLDRLLSGEHLQSRTNVKEPERLADNEKYKKMTPQEAAQAFFEACAQENWDEVQKFDTSPLSEDFKKTYGGLKIVSLGVPFQVKGGYHGWQIPYEIKLKDGEVKKWNLLMHNNNQAERYVFDGGL